MKTDTLILASAMDILACEIHCEDGVATAAIAEAAERLREQHQEVEILTARLEECRKMRSNLIGVIAHSHESHGPDQKTKP